MKKGDIVLLTRREEKVHYPHGHLAKVVQVTKDGVPTKVKATPLIPKTGVLIAFSLAGDKRTDQASLRAELAWKPLLVALRASDRLKHLVPA